MNELIVLKTFDFYKRNKFYDKIGRLLREYGEHFQGTKEELIQALVQKFNSRLSRYDKEEELLLQSILEEQILKLRQEDEHILYGKDEVDFHIAYFNLIAYSIQKVEESEKGFFQVLKERVERASELLKNTKIQTNLQLLKADLNQKTQLYLETAGDTGKVTKQDKIKNVSGMNKGLKLKTLTSYELYDVEEFCSFIAKLDAKGFFNKLESDYSTRQALEIYKNYQFITSKKHGNNYIYHYDNPKSKVLAYFLEACSKEDYNEKVMMLIEENGVTERQRSMYERVLTGKPTQKEKLPLAIFRNDQSYTEKEKSKLWGRNYLHNMNEGIKMPLGDLISPSSFFLREVFKLTELTYWMLGEINEVEAIYNNEEHGLRYHFTMENESFSRVGRINYSIIEKADYFFTKEETENFYDWIFGCIDILSSKKVSDPEAPEDANFYIQFLKYRLQHNHLSKEEFHYLFNADSLKAITRGKNPSDAVFELLDYAKNHFAIELEIDVFLKVMHRFDKEGKSLAIVERIYPEEYDFIRLILNELIREGKFDTLETAYLEFLK